MFPAPERKNRAALVVLLLLFLVLGGLATFLIVDPLGLHLIGGPPTVASGDDVPDPLKDPVVDPVVNAGTDDRNNGDKKNGADKNTKVDDNTTVEPDKPEPVKVDDTKQIVKRDDRRKKRLKRRRRSSPQVTKDPERVNDPVVEKRDPPVKPEPKTAVLFLRTTPYATVFLGKKKLGNTPLVGVTVPARGLTLRLVNKEAGINEEYYVKPKPGETLKKTLDLR